MLQSQFPPSSMPTLPCAVSPALMMTNTPSSSVSTSYSTNCERVEGGGRREPEEDEFSVLDLLVDVIRKSLITGCGNSVDESWEMEIEIGSPKNVRHVAHVTFDKFDGFLGLPVEFQPDVPSRLLSASASVFGVTTESMQLSFDQRGNIVPTILLMMQQRLYDLGGLQAEGIFRINGENGQEERVRDQLNHGVIPDQVDVHCLAGLIKAWFRELPRGVLDSLSPEEVQHSHSEEQCLQLVTKLSPTEAALLDWALNLMADVAQMEHLNKMNAYNVAVVFAPNMTQMADPLTALMHAVQLTNFLKILIETKLQERRESSVESPSRIDSPLSDAAKSSFSSPRTNNMSDNLIGLTDEPQCRKAGPRTDAQSNKPHSRRGSKAVSEKQIRANVDRISAAGHTNSRPKRFEAWR
ncbi:unnamed protein product [Rhodiola kirilowii]